MEPIKRTADNIFCVFLKINKEKNSYTYNVSLCLSQYGRSRTQKSISFVRPQIVVGLSKKKMPCLQNSITVAIPNQQQILHHKLTLYFCEYLILFFVALKFCIHGMKTYRLHFYCTLFFVHYNIM